MDTARPNEPRTSVERTVEADAERLAQIQAALLHWFDSQQIALPWREQRTPYGVLVSEFMLQQTQRERVAPKFRAFLLRFPDIRALAAASTADVIRAWAGLGYNNRAVRLQQIARQLVAAGETLPRDPAALRALPGVGEYTANAISCFGFDQAVACVDTNIRRVLGRIFRGDELPGKAAAALAAEVLVSERPADWNAALMDLGALICRARGPQCYRCPVAGWCLARPALAAEGREGERRVAEPRSAYAAGRRRRQADLPFAASDRYLRGRMVEVLRELPDSAGMPIDELAFRASGMALPPQTERARRLAQRMLREGLIAADASDGELHYRLPH